MKKVLLPIIIAVMALVFAPQTSQAGDFRISFSSGGHYGQHYGRGYHRPPAYCPPPAYGYYHPPRRVYYRRPVRVYRVAPPVYRPVYREHRPHYYYR